MTRSRTPHFILAASLFAASFSTATLADPGGGGGGADGLGANVLMRANPPPPIPQRVRQVTGTASISDDRGNSIGATYFDDGSRRVTRTGPDGETRTEFGMRPRPPKFLGSRKINGGGSMEFFQDRNTGERFVQLTGPGGQPVHVDGSTRGPGGHSYTFR